MLRRIGHDHRQRLRAGETWLTHVPGAMKMELPSMGDPNVSAFLLDVASSEHADAPITCAFFWLEKSAAALSYDYDETKLRAACRALPIDG